MTAPVLTYKSSVYQTTNTASTVTGSPTWTPAANSLLVCFVCTAYSASPTDPTAVNGHGIAYTKVPLGTSTLSTTHQLSCWVALAGATPTSAAPAATVTSTNGTGDLLIEFEVTGADVTGTALQAIIDSSATNNGTSTTPTVTLKAPGHTDNRAMTFVVQLSNAAPTAAGSWAIQAGASGNFNTPATGAAVLTEAAAFDTAGAATTANVAWRMVGIEIKAAQPVVVGGLNDNRPYASLQTGGGVSPPATPGLKGERGRPGPALRALMRHVDTQRFERPGVSPAGTAFTQAVTGGVSFAGSSLRAPYKLITAALSLSGALLARTTHSITAGLSFVGSRVALTSRAAIIATLSFVGAFTSAHIFNQALSGAVSFVGTQTRRINKSLTATASLVATFLKSVSTSRSGSLAFSGNVARSSSKLLTAALSCVGAISRSIIRPLTATLSFVGAQTGAARKALSGALVSSGSLARSVVHGMIATLGFVGSLSRRTAQTSSATLSFVGTLLRALSASLSGALSFSGTRNARTARSANASLSLSGATTKEASRLLTAALAFVGVVTGQATKTLAGSLGLAGVLSDQVGKMLVGALSVSGAITRFCTRTVSASVGFAGTVSRAVGKALAGLVAFIGTLIAAVSSGAVAYFQALSGALSLSGTETALLRRILTASLTVAGLITRRVGYGLTATANFVGACVKSAARSHSATLGAVGGLNERTGKTLAGSVNWSGAIRRRISRALDGLLSFIGATAAGRMFARALSASVALVGAQSIQVGKRLQASLGFVGILIRNTSFGLRATLVLMGSLSKATERGVAGLLAWAGSLTSGNVFARVLNASLAVSGGVSVGIGKMLDGTLVFAATLQRAIRATFTALLGFVATWLGVVVGRPGHITLETSARLMAVLTARNRLAIDTGYFPIAVATGRNRLSLETTHLTIQLSTSRP